MRESRFFDSSTFDDPTDKLEAGSTTEHDMLCEWDRTELVDLIQKLDHELSEHKEIITKYAHPLRCRGNTVACNLEADLFIHNGWRIVR